GWTLAALCLESISMSPIINLEETTQHSLHGIPFPKADILGVADQLNAEESERLKNLHEFLQAEIRPAVGEYCDSEELPCESMPRLAEFGLGEIVMVGTSRLFLGLDYAEVTRADVSISAFVGIHNQLVAALIQALASDSQREKWL